MAKFSIVPDHITARYNELSFSAYVLYTYYLRRYRKGDVRQKPVKESEVLSDIPAMPRRTYYEAKKELGIKGWIEESDSLIIPVEDPPKSATPCTRKSATHRTKRVQPTAPDSAADRTPEVQPTALKSATDCTVYKEVNPLDPSNTQYTDPKLQATSGESFSEIPEDPPAKGRKKSEGSVSTDDVVAVFELWKEKTNHPKAKLTDSRIKRIKARLKEGFTLEELRQCLDGWKISPWHQGVNPSETVYFKVETIFRDAEQVESFIAKAQQPSVIPIDQNGGLVVPEPVSLSFEDSMEMSFHLWEPNADPRELFERTKTNYLAKRVGPQYEAEVTEYENSDGFRERLEKARP